ncbi:MAG: glycosyltransferase family 4 protein [Caldiserica bacterium]|nr:glycosyltransferase family 4 protein [Caldisericota bacterium]
MKVLFLTLYSHNFPSTYFRVYQYLPYLKKAGIKYKIYPAIPEEWEETYYKGRKWKKIIFEAMGVGKRVKELISSLEYDVIFLQKGITPANFRDLERVLFLFNTNVIYDFDDAVYIAPPQEFRNKFFACFQDKKQVEKIIRKVKLVVAGNAHLARYAEKFNKEIKILPTPIDTDKYEVKEYKLAEKVVIGWSGSQSTNKYLNSIAPIISKLAKNMPHVLRIMSNSMKGIDKGLFSPAEVEFISWSREREAEVIRSFDIGVMPLEDDEWSRGKCGLKALQYMASGVPVVASPVGVNQEIIQDGINGFLANTADEWEDKLWCLLKESKKRKEFGLKGRETVEARYSLKVNAPRLIEILREVAT